MWHAGLTSLSCIYDKLLLKNLERGVQVLSWMSFAVSNNDREKGGQVRYLTSMEPYFLIFREGSGGKVSASMGCSF